MDTGYLPPRSLRDELIRVLVLYAERCGRGELPVLPPRGVLEVLNGFGPPLADRWVPLIEATLDSLWAEGLVGRIPAPSPWHAKGYCSRGAAERAIPRGAPIILLPRRGELGPTPRPPTRLRRGNNSRGGSTPQLRLLRG